MDILTELEALRDGWRHARDRSQGAEWVAACAEFVTDLDAIIRRAKAEKAEAAVECASPAPSGEPDAGLLEQIALIVRQAMPVDGDYYIEAEYLPVARRILAVVKEATRG